MGYEANPEIRNQRSKVFPPFTREHRLPRLETTVTKKIEDAVSSLENVKKVESKSFESLSLVTITLNAGADTDYALNDAQRKINAIIADFPKDVKAPSLQKFSLSDLPIITAGATSNLSSVAFYDLLDKKSSQYYQG